MCNNHYYTVQSLAHVQLLALLTLSAVVGVSNVFLHLYLSPGLRIFLAAVTM